MKNPDIELEDLETTDEDTMIGEFWFRNNFDRLKKLSSEQLAEEIHKRTKLKLLMKLKHLDSEVERVLHNHIVDIVGLILGIKTKWTDEMEFDSRYHGPSEAKLSPFTKRIAELAEKACAEGIDSWVKILGKGIPKKQMANLKDSFNERLYDYLYKELEKAAEKHAQRFKMQGVEGIKEALDELVKQEKPYVIKDDEQE